MSFSPQEIFESIHSHFPEFNIQYSPDFRQKIADTWPASIDDSFARKDWDWKAAFDLPAMTTEIITKLPNHLSKK
jgi:hypothetical protein